MTAARAASRAVSLAIAMARSQTSVVAGPKVPGSTSSHWVTALSIAPQSNRMRPPQLGGKPAQRQHHAPATRRAARPNPQPQPFYVEIQSTASCLGGGCNIIDRNAHGHCVRFAADRAVWRSLRAHRHAHVASAADTSSAPASPQQARLAPELAVAAVPTAATPSPAAERLPAAKALESSVPSAARARDDESRARLSSSSLRASSKRCCGVRPTCGAAADAAPLGEIRGVPYSSSRVRKTTLPSSSMDGERHASPSRCGERNERGRGARRRADRPC